MNENGIPGWESGIETLALLRPYVREWGDAPRPAWKIEERKLLDYLLVYIAEGEGRFVVDGLPFEARARDLFWIPPDTAHTMEGYGPVMVCPFIHFDLIYRPSHSHWAFSIPGGQMDLSDYDTLSHPPLDVPLLKQLTGRLRNPNNQRVGTLIQDVCDEMARGRAFCGFRASGLVMEIVAELLRGLQEKPSIHQTYVRRLEAAADQMRKNCGHPVSVEAIARQARLSPSRFRQIFRDYFGLSPRQWLRQVRIQKARDLMGHTSLNLSEIAREVGFETVHSFSRAFKELEGIPPSAYRATGGHRPGQFPVVR